MNIFNNADVLWNTHFHTVLTPKIYFYNVRKIKEQKDFLSWIPTWQDLHSQVGKKDTSLSSTTNHFCQLTKYCIRIGFAYYRYEIRCQAKTDHWSIAIREEEAQ